MIVSEYWDEEPLTNLYDWLTDWYVVRPSLTPSATPGRLPRHPQLPPLHIEDNTGPKLQEELTILLWNAEKSEKTSYNWVFFCYFLLKMPNFWSAKCWQSNLDFAVWWVSSF